MKSAVSFISLVSGVKGAALSFKGTGGAADASFTYKTNGELALVGATCLGATLCNADPTISTRLTSLESDVTALMTAVGHPCDVNTHTCDTSGECTKSATGVSRENQGTLVKYHCSCNEGFMFATSDMNDNSCIATSAPTPYPTAIPTAAPTMSPTFAPTPYPTAFPTASPTKAPTAFPTAAPTASPTLTCADYAGHIQRKSSSNSYTSTSEFHVGSVSVKPYNSMNRCDVGPSPEPHSHSYSTTTPPLR